MSDDGQWSTVTSGRRKKKRTRPRQPSQAVPSATAFQALRAEIPHLMLPADAKAIAREKNIDGLAAKFATEAWIEVQRSGWQYIDVIKPQEHDRIPAEPSYQALPLDNRWNDMVLFKRVE